VTTLHPGGERYKPMFGAEYETAVQPPVGRCNRCGITVFYNSNPQPPLCTGCRAQTLREK
jgi:hypothetical protein